MVAQEISHLFKTLNQIETTSDNITTLPNFSYNFSYWLSPIIYWTICIWNDFDLIFLPSPANKNMICKFLKYIYY